MRIDISDLGHGPNTDAQLHGYYVIQQLGNNLQVYNT